MSTFAVSWEIAKHARLLNSGGFQMLIYDCPIRAVVFRI